MLFNGRFAIMMRRKWGDLRKLIDTRMIHNIMLWPPFADSKAKLCMREIAEGMKCLHQTNITHGDLKAENVLVSGINDEGCFAPNFFKCEVADYECSVRVVGTGFCRAPEILLAVKNGHVRPELFTKASDVYSYGMLCYEIITGHLPFEVEGYKATHYYKVIEGCRPCLPTKIPQWMKELLRRCWHKDPSERPTFILYLIPVSEIEYV